MTETTPYKTIEDIVGTWSHISNSNEFSVVLLIKKNGTGTFTCKSLFQTNIVQIEASITNNTINLKALKPNGLSDIEFHVNPMTKRISWDASYPGLPELILEKRN